MKTPETLPPITDHLSTEAIAATRSGSETSSGEHGHVYPYAAITGALAATALFGVFSKRSKYRDHASSAAAHLSDPWAYNPDKKFQNTFMTRKLANGPRVPAAPLPSDDERAPSTLAKGASARVARHRDHMDELRLQREYYEQTYGEDISTSEGLARVLNSGNLTIFEATRARLAHRAARRRKEKEDKAMGHLHHAGFRHEQSDAVKAANLSVHEAIVESEAALGRHLSIDEKASIAAHIRNRAATDFLGSEASAEVVDALVAHMERKARS